MRAAEPAELQPKASRVAKGSCVKCLHRHSVTGSAVFTTNRALKAKLGDLKRKKKTDYVTGFCRKRPRQQVQS